MYLSYDCEGDQDRTHVRQSSYTCAAPATTTTTTTTTTTAAVDSAVSFVEVSSDCPHDPGSSCYLQSKTGMDWHQAGKVEKSYFTSTFIYSYSVLFKQWRISGRVVNSKKRY